MAIRMTGMISGMDTESLIKSMLDAQKLKNKRVTDKKDNLTFKQDKWKELNAKLLKLYTEDLSKMRLQGNYQTKAVTSSNENLVSVTGNVNATEGTHIIKDTKLASAQYITGKVINKVGKDGKAITGTSKLVDDLGMDDGTLITIKVKGSATTLEINKNTTVDEFVQKCKNAGLNASYDTNQKRFFLSSKESGVENQFTITTSLDTGIEDRRKIDTAVGYSSLSSTDKAKVDAAYKVLQEVSTANVEAAYLPIEDPDTASDEVKKAREAISTLQDLTAKRKTATYTNEANTIATELVKTELTDAIKLGGTNESLYNEFVSDAKEDIKRKYDYDESIEFTEEPYKSELDALVTSYINTQVTSELNTDEVKAKIISKRDDLIANALSTANAELIDNINKYVSSNAIESTTGQLSNLGLTEITKDENGKVIVNNTTDDIASGNIVTLVEANNSQINYNGATLTGNSNVITVNGLTITLKGEIAANETVSLNVTNNTQATYDMVKKFITSYNDILKEMNALYYAGSSKGYDPLSDDERESMSDDQIEKWETKIKDSILRRDSSLGSLLNAMKSSMNTTVKVPAETGKTYSLSSFGIQTSSDYTEKGLLHIYGNADDSVYSANADKLMKALEEDPETVMEVLSGISKNLYDTMADKMKAIPNVSSALTFYNDKLMTNQQSDYSKKISVLEKKLVEMENKYYKQFAAMETAMAKMQSQSNTLASMLGTSTK